MTRLALPKPSRESRQPKRRIRNRRKGGKAWAARECDRLWSLIVRASNGGQCFLATDGRGHKCAGPLQAAHGYSRRYRVTRWLLINGFPLCSGAHVRYTHDPLGWMVLLAEWWGDSVFQQLRREALSMVSVDVYAKLVNLRAEAKKLGLEAA